MTAQALLGQTYTSHTDLWASLDERREVLNHHLPSRALSHKPPLEAYPGAIHSGRSYRPEWEEELLSLEKVCTYLAQARWFRGVRSNGFFGEGAYQYYLGKHFAKLRVSLRFDPETMVLICLPEGCEETFRLPIQGITKAELMGEPAVFQSLPAYQLALPFSFLRFTISADTTWFIRCHLHVFAYLGGVPKRLLYDNLKSVVLRRDADDVVQWNPRFLDFADVAGFSPQACKPYRPQTKGKVENGVKYVRGNFWPGLHFQDLDDLNAQALAWLNTTANPRVHGTTGEVPFTRLRSEGLQAVDKALTYDTSILITRRSSKDCFISYSGNLYSVPAAYARKTLQVKITEAEELVICSEVGQELARHRVLCGRQERSVQADHYRGLGTPVSRVEQASAVQELRQASRTMFWDAPVVEVRSLSVYDQLLGEVS